MQFELPLIQKERNPHNSYPLDAQLSRPGGIIFTIAFGIFLLICVFAVGSVVLAMLTN